MSSYTNIFFWEPTLSPHKVDLINEIKSINKEINIYMICDSNLTPDRVNLGWEVYDNIAAQVIISPSEIEIRRLVANCESSLHIFSGIRHFKSIILGLKQVKKYRRDFAIMSEPRVAEGFSGLVRYIQSWITEGWLRKNVKFVLAIGANGRKWFKSVGYKSDGIYPFAYFVHCPKITRTKEDHVLRVIYVGRIVEEKGVQYLVDAFLNYEDLENVELIIVGDGTLKNTLIEKSINKKNLIFKEPVKYKDVGNYIANADILVLPSISTNDGWGVVVSEALMIGTCVIVTDAVGSSILLSNIDYNGIIVNQKSSVALKDAILRVFKSNLHDDCHRSMRRDWAISRLTARAGADYLLKIIDANSKGVDIKTIFK